MAIYLCVEQEYVASSWCSEILEGISQEKKRKKIKILPVQTIAEIPADRAGEISSVLLIGSRHTWLAKNIDLVRTAGMNPIVLGNTQQSGIYAKYSSVSSDVFGVVGAAIKLCTDHKKPRIALYGINPDSTPDAMRKQAFLTFGGEKRDIFYNQGLLKGCFYNFLPFLDQYDAILCANEFAAVSLLHRFKKESISTDRLFIISCTDSVLCRSVSPTITSYSIHFQSFGRAALSIHETLRKNPFITSLNCLIDYTLNVGETTPGIDAKNRFAPLFAADREQDINIYNDPEMAEMIAAEALLRNAKKDPLDLKILEMLHAKKSTESISEATFLSVSAVKYRIRNLCKMFGATGTAELLDKVRRYHQPIE